MKYAPHIALAICFVLAALLLLPTIKRRIRRRPELTVQEFLDIMRKNARGKDKDGLPK